jgi:hypothetical protein
MNKFTFTTKETYLQYRSAWKDDYKELSKTIKERKWLRKEWQRAYNKTYINLGDPFSNSGNYDKFRAYEKVLLDEVVGYNEMCSKHNLRIPLETLRKNARIMNETLKLAKEEAQRQYLEQKMVIIH